MAEELTEEEFIARLKKKGVPGITMELEVRPGVKKKYIIGKLTQEEIEIVGRDAYMSTEAYQRKQREMLRNIVI